VFPIFELVAAHPEFAAGNRTYTNVTVSGFKITFFETHGLRTIATAPALVKHQFAVPDPKFCYQLPGAWSK